MTLLLGERGYEINGQKMATMGIAKARAGHGRAFNLYKFIDSS